MLQIRKAKPEDLRQIMPLYEKAREFMEKNGNPTQWGKNNPPEDLIRKDIKEGYLLSLIHISRTLFVFLV